MSQNSENSLAWVRTEFVSPQAPPVNSDGIWAWVRDNFLSSWTSRILTVVAVLAIFWVLRALFVYMFWHASLLPLPTDRVEGWWDEILADHQEELADWQARVDALSAETDPENARDVSRLARLERAEPRVPEVIPSHYWWTDYFSRPHAYLPEVYQGQSVPALAWAVLTRPLTFLGGEVRTVDFSIAGVTTTDRGASIWRDCRARQQGACWPFVGKRIHQFVFGKHPPATQWRIVSVWLVSMVGILLLTLPASGREQLRKRTALGLLIAGLISATYALMPHVDATRWLQAGILGLGALLVWRAPPTPRFLAAVMGFMLVLFPLIAASLFLGGEANPSALLYGLLFLAIGLAGVFYLHRFWEPARFLGAVLTYCAVAYFLVGGQPWGLFLPTEKEALWSMAHVDTQEWSGFFLTFVLGAVGIVVSLPIGVVLALGRRSDLPLIRLVSTSFIEFWRGVPLITVLFFFVFVFGLMLPESFELERMLLILTGITFFSSAYMAEVVRGGLQALPKGQQEAANSLGLSFWQGQQLIILPQALTLVIPGIVNTFIGLFKDTTLVIVLGMEDFLGIVRAGAQDPTWAVPRIALTGFLFVSLVFFILNYGMSVYSRRIEYVLSDSKKN